MTVRVTVAKTVDLRKLLAGVSKSLANGRMPIRYVSEYFDPHFKTALNRRIKIRARKHHPRHNDLANGNVFAISSGRGRAKVYKVMAQGRAKLFARILNQGGTIKPVHHKFLSIPLDAAKTRNWKSPWDVPDGTSFTIDGRGGNKIMMLRLPYISKSQAAGNTRKANMKNIVPIFSLRKQVVVTASHWATRAIQDAIKQDVPETITATKKHLIRMIKEDIAKSKGRK